MNNYIDNECIKTLRVMGAEIITKAKSGHPGIVLGAAPIVHTLFTRHLNIDAKDGNGNGSNVCDIRRALCR